jgi:adenylate cyclase
VGRFGTHDQTVIELHGSSVNLTIRLEAMTKAFGVPIIVSEEIARRIAQADPNGREMITRRLGLVIAKGFPEPLWAYELASTMNPSTMNDFLRHEWDTAVTEFTEGNWADAYEHLEGVFDEDPAARCLLRVMDSFGRRKPIDWTGAFVPPSPDEGRRGAE